MNEVGKVVQANPVVKRNEYNFNLKEGLNDEKILIRYKSSSIEFDPFINKTNYNLLKVNSEKEITIANNHVYYIDCGFRIYTNDYFNLTFNVLEEYMALGLFILGYNTEELFCSKKRNVNLKVLVCNLFSDSLIILKPKQVFASFYLNKLINVHEENFDIKKIDDKCD